MNGSRPTTSTSSILPPAAGKMDVLTAAYATRNKIPHAAWFDRMDRPNSIDSGRIRGIDTTREILVSVPSITNDATRETAEWPTR